MVAVAVCGDMSNISTVVSGEQPTAGEVEGVVALPITRTGRCWMNGRCSTSECSHKRGMQTSCTLSMDRDLSESRSQTSEWPLAGRLLEFEAR